MGFIFLFIANKVRPIKIHLEEVHSECIINDGYNLEEQLYFREDVRYCCRKGYKERNVDQF